MTWIKGHWSYSVHKIRWRIGHEYQTLEIIGPGHLGVMNSPVRISWCGLCRDL